MNNNFYSYVNNKYLEINKKINKTEFKMNKIKQAGGNDTLAKLQIDLAHLEVLKNIIKKKIDVGDKVDFAKIEEPLTRLVNELGEFGIKINEKLEASSELNLQKMLNQMGKVQQFITNGEGNYLDIKLQNIPKLVHPPIEIPTINESHTQILQFIEDKINELIKKIKSSELESEEEFKKKLEEIKKLIVTVDEKTVKLAETTKLIEERIKEINNYSDITLTTVEDKDKYIQMNEQFKDIDIRPDLFLKTNDKTVNETINMDKLESAITLQEGKIATDTSENFDQVIKDIKIDGALLVKPKFMELKLVGGIGDKDPNIYLYSKDDVKQVIEKLFNKWTNKIKDIDTKLKEKQQYEQDHLYSKIIINKMTKLKKNKLNKLSDNINKLKNIVKEITIINKDINRHISYDCLSSNAVFKTKLIDINNLTTNIEAFITNLVPSINEIDKLSSTIISETDYDKLSNQVTNINEQVDLKLLELEAQLESHKNLIMEFNSDCFINPSKAKIDRGVEFIINLIKIPYIDSKKLFIQLFVWNYNLIVPKLELKYTATLNDKTIVDLLNKLTYTQKNNLILSYLTEIDKNNFDLNKQKLNILSDNFILNIKNIFKTLFKLPTIQKDKITKILEFMFSPEKIKEITLPNDTVLEQEILKNKQAEYKQIKTIIEKNKLELVGGYLQTGGLINSWENYYFQIIDMFMKINNYKNLFNNFKKVAREFNIKYIQLYHHQLYISNYIQIVLLGDTYQIYQYLSKGSVNYYRQTVTSIFEKCKDPKTVETNPVIRYFYKYHYVTLDLLVHFLEQLKNNWSVDYEFYSANKDINDKHKLEQNKNESRLAVITPERLPHTDKMKKGLFIFNLFKDILDSYSYTYASPVAVYLRINDYSGNVGKNNDLPNDLPEVFKKDEKKSEKLVLDQLDLCKGDIEAVKNATPETELKNLPNIINDFNKIEFTDIFDSYGFSDNATLAMYMNIPTYLAKGKSIMMITYGYSGVGKTFTLFGQAKGDQKKPGILQKALLSIQNKQAIYMRTYEIYGRALPYKSYWTNLKSSDYDHKIISYTFGNDDGDSQTNATDIEKNDMTSYLGKIKNNDSESYLEITVDQINGFETFIDNVDKIRLDNGRIKETVNNPSSSRSIMVYEFKVKLQDNKYVRFVVMDLPGKEDIKSSYVYPNKKPDALKDQYCIKLKDDILKDGDISYNEDAIRAAIFLNPLFISIFPSISEKIYSHFYTKLDNDSEFMKKFGVVSVTTPKKQQPPKSYITTKLLTEYIREIDNPKDSEFILLGRSSSNSSEDMTEFRKKFRKCFIASEIMRFLLEQNRLVDIINFYNEELFDVSDECKTKNSAGLPFEGFYINENILGLVNELRTRLNPNFSVDEKNLMGDYFSTNMGVYNVYDNDKFEGPLTNIYKDETIAQTYFIRNLLRDKITNNNQPDFLISNKGNHVLNNNNKTAYNDNKIMYSTSNGTKGIKSWLEDAYDFNKSYTTKPPIKTFMDAYFSKQDLSDSNSDYVINNFYLFYVVNNESVNKCANQIKLIADSKDFINAIKNYRPDDAETSTPAKT
jgi:hypothetical protein